MIKKILIANRGEIAVRIIKAAHAMNIRVVAVYSEGEETAAHVMMADEAACLGKGSLSDTYLNISKIIAAARDMGAEAVHPGYGFLSENHQFAESCRENGIRFIGPSPEVLHLMGNKPEAKALAASLGIPVLTSQAVSEATVNEVAPMVRYPVIIKSAFGGGGKGMKAVYTPEVLQEQVVQASRMAANYFGNGTVYLEPFIEKARHIEVQVLGDDHGNLVHLYERDCTVQRNYQKIIEEAPAHNLDPQVREALLKSAVALCREVHYSGAGTVEFLLGQDGRFFFMEMNPRIQVEHPVTEEVTGIDIVSEQLRIASGMPLSFRQEEISVSGHAVEVRVYSENPLNGFTPSTAPVTFFRLPEGPHIRIETDLNEYSAGSTSQFDPLLCKIITHGMDRKTALNHMQDALRSTVIAGPVTNQTWLKTLINSREVRESTADTGYCERNAQALSASIMEELENSPDETLIAAYLALKFLPENPWSASPWERLGSANILSQVEISDGKRTYRVPFRVIPAEKFISQTRFSWHDLIPGNFSHTEIQKNMHRSPSHPFAGRAAFGNAAQKHGQRNFSGETANTAVPFQFTWNDQIHYALASKTSDHSVQVSTENKSEKIFFSENLYGKTVLYWDGFEIYLSSPDLLEFYPKPGSSANEKAAENDHRILSPMHGKIIQVGVSTGQMVTKGDLLVIIESMKSENHIRSPRSGKIISVEVEAGMQVNDRTPLILFEEI
jgi:acetyl/propionyl-CoA carboxylase alpha subunit